MTVFEMIFDPALANNGVHAISLVEKPAIESNFVALKDMPLQLAAVKERHVVLGAVLIPNKPILRRDPKSQEEFYIFFSKETIEQVAEFYMLRGLQAHTTVEHEVNAKGITLVETWLVADAEKDKAAAYGLQLPVGTWVGAMKVENDVVWDEFIKEGKLNGFSIEGYFGMEVRDEMLAQAKRLPAPEEKKTLGSLIEELSNKF